MILTCPHCGKPNDVAGWFWQKCSSQGHTDRTVICGYCGKRWERKEPEAKTVEGE